MPSCRWIDAHKNGGPPSSAVALPYIEYPRQQAEVFVNEEGKKLAKDNIELRPASKPYYFKINNLTEPKAELMIQVKADGDFTLQVLIRPMKAVICRYDRAPHHKGKLCMETGEEIGLGHKHYYERNIEGQTLLVSRGENEIPTRSIPAAVRAFCEELSILPPANLKAVVPVALKVAP